MATINVLTDVETKEVSLVKRGANRKVIALSKSESDMDNILEAVLGTEAEGEAKVLETFKNAGLSEKGMEAATGLYRLLTAFKDELNGEGVGSVIKAAGFEAPTKKDEGTPTPEPTSKGMDLNKMDPAVRQQVEAIFKSNKEAIEKAEKLEKALNDERELRVVKEWTEKAETQFSHIPAKASELAVIMKSLHTVDGELAKKVEELLSTVNETVKKSELLVSKGRAHMPSFGGAWDEIVTKAKDIMAKSSEKVTQAKAIDMFLATPEGKELYQQYLIENPAQSGVRA